MLYNRKLLKLLYVNILNENAVIIHVNKYIKKDEKNVSKDK